MMERTAPIRIHNKKGKGKKETGHQMTIFLPREVPSVQDFHSIDLNHEHGSSQNMSLLKLDDKE